MQQEMAQLQRAVGDVIIIPLGHKKQHKTGVVLGVDGTNDPALVTVCELVAEGNCGKRKWTLTIEQANAALLVGNVPT